MRPIFILVHGTTFKTKNNYNSSFTQDSMLALNGEDSGSGTEINLIFLIISIVVSLNPVSNSQYWIIWLQTVNRTPTWKPQRISYIVMCTKCLMIRRPVIFSRNLHENLKSRSKLEVLNLTERRLTRTLLRLSSALTRNATDDTKKEKGKSKLVRWYGKLLPNCCGPAICVNVSR